MRPSRLLLALPLVLVVGACGLDDSAGSSGSAEDPSIVVTTNVLGDVVGQIVGDEADLTTIMPVGADPHDFQASAQQAAAMRDADLLVVNGGGFEEGLEDVIEGAEDDGVRVVAAIDAVETLEPPEVDEHADEPAKDEEKTSEGADEHGHEEVDPHFFTDPSRMVQAVEALVDAIVEVDGIDEDAVRARADDYVAELEALDDHIESTRSKIPAEDRVLVTNHEVFGYLAERYGFEVVGTVIPSGSTSEGASAGDLSELVDTLRARGVRAVFADASAPNRLAETLAGEVGEDVEVIELYSESLGEPGSEGASYLEMMRTNADRIVEALT